ncbi:serine hydrolase domain-containing protein [Brachybacterium sacelli]|uniref:CubicO group peptidase (Beta-lactamase class C family) n=1 Tax=Brachybacterium sacelli TaxID=173364 RepID=A0ABS4WWL6_9MICO|nr:serine hydrolase domain-containing protein [Brachybacterium sacelli]MBP2380553.1 CubicO group peptidase (beta-lactamase class C family) [Brachybacterium sacelli]
MDPQITRRTGLTAAALASATTAVGLPAAAFAEGDPAPDKDDSSRRSARSAPSWSHGEGHRHPWDRRPSGRTLHEATPQSVGLDPAVLEELPGILRAGLEVDPARFSGASVLVASQAGIAVEHADGYALRWKNASEQLPEDQWVQARTDTLYDLASISKIFTATSVMQLVEEGSLALDDPVASHLPSFAEGGKGQVTVQHLLTHTGGLPATLGLYSDYPDVPSRIDAALTVAPDAPPGTAYVYSDLGLIALGLVVEKLSGQGLDEYVRKHITEPLGMSETMYNPPAELRDRIAATEYIEYYGELVHGHVHDENAYSLGGVAGHAGVFSTAKDLAVFAQMFLGGGRYGDARILEPQTVQEMYTDRIAEITGVGGDRRGLGPELEAWFYHAGLTSPYSGTHTGFTGTSLVIDPLTDTIVILLTNSVHPTREWSSTSETRRGVSTCVAHALGIVPEEVREGWHAGDEDSTTATLSAAVDLPAAGSGGGSREGSEGSGSGGGSGDPEQGPTVLLDLFTHLETAYDVLAVEASADQGSTWAPLAGTLEARHQQPIAVPDGQITGWGRRRRWQGAFPLVDGEEAMSGEVELRLTLTTDRATRGLGAWVGRIRVTDGKRDVLDTARTEDREHVVAEGWTRGE